MVDDKLLGEWSPRELQPSETKNLGDQLETILATRRIFVIECYSRYISHKTYSCIFKNLIGNKTLTASFCGCLTP